MEGSAESRLSVVNDGFDDLLRGALRSRRFERPGLASKGTRAATFNAALEQAEQLWSASARIGPEASPILLFYGLTQAGRAVCAAHLSGDRWKPLHGHGLSFNMAEPAQGAVPALSSIVVTPSRDGHVHQVAEALGSPVLAEPTALADLLAALDTKLFFENEDLPGRRPLRVHEDGMLVWVPGEPVKKSLYVRPLPNDLAQDTMNVPAGPKNLAYTRHLPPSSAQIADWLGRYPRLCALGAPDTIGDPEPAGLRRGETGWAIRLGWNGSVDETRQTDWTVNQLDVVYSDDWGGGEGTVLPAVGGNAAAQKPLITWWLVLYSLSMLARYHPREWSAMIDVDRSPVAVPLEQLLANTTSELLRLVVQVL